MRAPNIRRVCSDHLSVIQEDLRPVRVSDNLFTFLIEHFSGNALMIHLKIPPELAISLLEERLDDMKTIRTTQQGPEYYDMVGWLSKTCSAIDQIYGGDDIHPEEIRMIGLPACSCNAKRDTWMLLELYQSRLLEYIDEIRVFMKRQG